MAAGFSCAEERLGEFHALLEERLAGAAQLPAAGELLLLGANAAPTMIVREPTRAILFGGQAPDGPRKLVWNFVSSRPERIEQAKADWAGQTMGRVPGETEFIPFP
jgi:redox-sensitive bicupin YhaK (pirin superfamily)